MNRLSLAPSANSEGCAHSQSTKLDVGSTVESRLVHVRFEAQVLATPDAVALELDGKVLSYRELNVRANRLAHHLRRLGVGPGVLVGISMERSFDMVVSIYAILKAGGAYVPLDPTYPRERLCYMAKAAKLSFLVTHNSCSQIFVDLQDLTVLLLDEHQATIDACLASNLEPLSTPDDLIYVIFTSGSTGQPKAAAVYHRGFANLVDWFVDEFAISSDDKALLVSSLSFDLTQKNLYATLVVGGTLHLYPPSPYDISVLSRLLHEHGITLLNCTPSAFYPLVEPFDDESARSLSSLRVVFLGGESISIPRLRPWLTHTTCCAEIANTYGPTECTDICGFYRLTRDNLDTYDFVPLGRAIHHVQMVIVDSDKNRCGIGVAGELCVGGVGVGAGYINDVAMTQQKFVAHEFAEVTSPLLYRTGDQARWHSDGLIEFLGRFDHQVKIRGFRIELPEIERAAETHSSVNAAYVIVKSDPSDGESQLACCVAFNSGSTATVAELKSYLAEKLPAHMIPSSFEVFESFPLSPNGKVDRRALAEQVQQRHQCVAIPAVADGVSFEDQIRAAWCQLLSREYVGLDDNFFDLGGDSLRLARLHQHLESLIERTFSITDLFAHPTVRGMSRSLGGDSDAHDKQQDREQVRDRARMQREAQAARRRGRS